VPALATGAVAVGVAIWAGQSGHRLRTDVPAEPAAANTADRDDDAHWIAGLIYHEHLTADHVGLVGHTPPNPHDHGA
jgi:uncharacterized membrane protein